MHVNMYVCMYAYLCMYAFMHVGCVRVYMSSLSHVVYACMYACIYVCVYVCMHACIHMQATAWKGGHKQACPQRKKQQTVDLSFHP
jgi:hypothetical protein